MCHRGYGLCLCGHIFYNDIQFCDLNPEKPDEGWIRNDPKQCPKWGEFEHNEFLTCICELKKCDEAYEGVVDEQGQPAWRKKQTADEKRREEEEERRREEERREAEAEEAARQKEKGKGKGKWKGKGKGR